jgi:peptidoglycan/xylan/chitin deacetylase (PgdA/CDA1 family)
MEVGDHMSVPKKVKGILRDGLAGILDLTGVHRRILRQPESLVILTFHRVLPKDHLSEYPIPEIAVSSDEIEWILGTLRDSFSFGTLKDTWTAIVNGDSGNKPRMAITFDDGQLDNYVNAAPILDAMGVSGTFFVPVEAVEKQTLLWHDRMAYAIASLGKRHIGKSLLSRLEMGADEASNNPRNGVQKAKTWDASRRLHWIEEAEELTGGWKPAWDGMMSWDHVRDLAARGHEIGSHTLTHPRLVQCGKEELEDEIIGSRKILLEKTGAEISSFCYPNGDTDDRVLKTVDYAGFGQAVTTKEGSNNRASQRLELRRYNITSRRLHDRNGSVSPTNLRFTLSGIRKAR